MLDSQQWQAINVDITIVAQQPKMAPHTEAMQAHIASDLGLEPQAINVKATTTEKLGYIGREEGIACHAVALLAAQADKEA